MGVIRTYRAGIIIDHSIAQDIVVKPGTQSPDIINSFEAFNVSTNVFTTKASMKYPRAGHQQFTIGSNVYVIGGTDGSIILDSAEKYNISGNAWTDAANMPTPRCYFAAAQSGTYIYCIGGIVSDFAGNVSLSNALERYDTATDTWTTLASLPSGCAFSVAQIASGKIILLSGYYGSLYSPNSNILVYDISGNSWTSTAITDADELALYKRLSPFSYIDGSYIYVLDGIFYEVDNTKQPPATSRYLLQDTYRINTSSLLVERADRYFKDVPKTRYSGATATLGTNHYFIGGVNDTSNTLRYIERIDSSGNYTLIDKLTRGRSSLGVSPYSTDTLFISGGVISENGPNFLKVELESIPNIVQLNSKETAAITVKVTDENGDSPSSVDVLLTADNSPVLFVNDKITINNGYGLATLRPRGDDASGEMQNSVERSYIVTVKGSIVDATYFGETDTLPPQASATQLSITGGVRPQGEFPDGIVELKRYDSTVYASSDPRGSFLALENLGGIIDLTPNTVSGKDTSLTYINSKPWIPVVNQIINDNGGNYLRMIDSLDRLSRQDCFGGSPILDAISGALADMEFDTTTAKKTVYLQSDGDENCSHATENDIVNSISAISGSKMFPVVSSVFRTVPHELHLDQGIRGGSPLLEKLAGDTGGSANYVITDSDIDSAIRKLFISQGFIGNGLFTCEIDLGEEVRIESITANFAISDPETDAYWSYSVGDRRHRFSILSDRNSANSTVELYQTDGQYVKFVIEFLAELTTDTYNPEVIIPPRLTSIDIVYHQPTTSYIYLKPEETVDQVHSTAITLDALQGPSNSINVGITSANTTTWDDFSSPAQPLMDNNSRIVIPIRRSLIPQNRFSLEPLKNIDGFIFEARYGAWATDSDVTVYDENGNTVDGYRSFPKDGYVIFQERKTANYVIEIKNKPNLSVAAEITNRVLGEPVIITGAAFMYSTTQPISLSQPLSKVLPEAINLLLLPLNPDVNSIFRASYAFYDIKGRAEGSTVINWYINGSIQTDISGVRNWDNSEWKLAKSGDSVYFTVQPKTADATGRTVKSLPVQLI